MINIGDLFETSREFNLFLKLPGDPYSGLLYIPSRSLTVRPRKVTGAQEERNLPSIIFQGRTVKLRGCNGPLIDLQLMTTF